MQKVFVLDKNKKPLMPCSTSRARQLLTQNKASVFKQHPCTIILKERECGELQDIEIKLDPGSKTTGLALLGDLVKAVVLKGVKKGTYSGRVAVRRTGNFCIDTLNGKVDGISYKNCRHTQHSDGYAYLLKKQKEEQRFLPVLKNGVSALSKR